MPSWILESPYSHSIERILGSCLKKEIEEQGALTLYRYYYPNTYELWHLYNESNQLVGALLLQHDEYVTFTKMVHVPEIHRQCGWSSWLYRCANKLFGPLVYSEERTVDGNRYLPT